MGNLKLKVEVSQNAAVAVACAELQALANRIDIITVARMNGVDCYAYPGGDAVTLATRQKEVEGSSSNLKSATSLGGRIG